MNYHGQFGEPQYLDTYFNSKTNGVAVEVGADDGVSGSNTCFFERYRNWNCLCIEPVPEKYNICKQSRKNAINCCAGKETTTAEFSIVTLGNNNTSAISSLAVDERLIDSHKHLIEKIEKISVNVLKLTDILDNCNFPRKIDFISIDTENTEIDVLHGFDLNKYDVKVLLIENNFNESLHYDYIKQFGYKKIARLGVNDIYEKQETNVMTEISIGEIVDKYSILEIKSSMVTDKYKLDEIEKEKTKLSHALDYINSNKFFYKLLLYINKEIWNLTDRIKQMGDINIEYAHLANQIFNNNQIRFRLKTYFNILQNSQIKEQKSYSENTIQIVITDIYELIFKVEEINYLCVTNDNIIFDTNNDTIQVISNMFKNPSIIYNNTSMIEKKIFLKDFSLISNTDIYSSICSNREVYSFDDYITYNIGGLLGDFIHSLYIVYNNFLQTGKKGLIYMSSDGDGFRNGLITTYNEIYQLIKAQPYIYDLQVHTNQKYEVNLNSWRNVILLPEINHVFSKAYNHTYKIDHWGSKQWMFFDNIINKYAFNFEKYSNATLINTCERRFPITDISTYVVPNTYFISFNDTDYSYFLNKTNIQIPHIKLSNIYELCYVLSICKLFIGSYSMPLSLAYAMDINHVSLRWVQNMDLYQI
jgi:FkbM family methyltransferase